MKKVILSAAILASLFACTKHANQPANIRITGDHVNLRDSLNFVTPTSTFKKPLWHTRFFYQFATNGHQFTPTDSTVAEVEFEGSIFSITIPANEATGYLIPRGTGVVDTLPSLPVKIVYAFNKSFQIFY